MAKKVPSTVGSSAEARRDFFFAEAKAYQKKHKCRWSEACLDIKRIYGNEARVSFGAPLKAAKSN